jgi:carboxyl-terminal processing protease
MSRFPKGLIAATLAASLMLGAGATAQVYSKKTDAQKRAEDAAMIEKLRLFGDVFSRVRDLSVEETPDDELIAAAMNGALSALDPHSSYVPPARFEEQQVEQRREYGGLGIEVTQELGLVKVQYALEDGPAFKAGIRTGDYITAVEGEKVRGKSLDEAIKGMKGLAGDPVTVTVLNAQNVTKDIVVIRQQVRGRAVRHRVLDGLGYVFLETFNNDNLARDLERALDDLKRQIGGDIPGLILDLRGNRGGLLDQSVDVSSLFLDGGEVLSSRGRTPEETERYHAKPGQYDADMPIVVLINSGSASAAEIVAGALQDRGRAVVLGRRSFGKGSVQSVIPLGSPVESLGALRLTTQRYYTPSGGSIQGRGIMPDLLVALSPDSGKLEKRFREDSLRNSLGNPDDSDYIEKYEDIDYPPEDWPIDEDYQLSKAKDLLRSSRYQSLVAEFNR